MPLMHRVVSTVLLSFGLVLVFAGLVSALGRSALGIGASAAVIGGLLYAGASWFGGGSPRDGLVFDRQLAVHGHGARVRSVADLFPPPLRSEIEQRCRDALAGVPLRFVCAADPGRQPFDVAPIRTADGAIRYGILMTAREAPAPAPLSPVA
ncbi:MAG TPA: hypothetical protein VFX12_00255 [Vicinamibacterales bacterium]|nr:hypothetical protein [Vicinamibacterales bacterium]